MPKIVTAFRVDEAQLEGLRQLYDRDGVQVSESVRRAIAEFLKKKGIAPTKITRKSKAP